MKKPAEDRLDDVNDTEVDLLIEAEMLVRVKLTIGPGESIGAKIHSTGCWEDWDIVSIPRVERST